MNHPQPPAQLSPNEVEYRRHKISLNDLGHYRSGKEHVAVGVADELNQFEQRLNQSCKAKAEEKEPPITQGSTADCFLIAPLRDLAKRDPQAIDKMIIQDKDGTVTVKFPGVDKPITTQAPTEAEIASYANNRPAAIIEKAFGLYHYALQEKFAALHRGSLEALDSNSRGEMRPSKVPAERMKGGAPREAIEALTGSKAKEFWNDNFADELHQQQYKGYRKEGASAANLDEIIRQVQQGAQKGALMIAATTSDIDSHTGISSNHAYGVTYDKASGCFVLRNPLPAGDQCEPMKHDGTALDGKLDGQFKLTPEQAAKYLLFVTIEQKN